MARVPAHHMHIEVAHDAATNTAHRRAPTSRTTPSTDRNLPDRCAANCAGGEATLRPMSAHTADRNGAQACDHELCFGRDLAEPAPQFRLIVAPRKTARGRR